MDMLYQLIRASYSVTKMLCALRFVVQLIKTWPIQSPLAMQLKNLSLLKEQWVLELAIIWPLQLVNSLPSFKSHL